MTTFEQNQKDRHILAIDDDEVIHSFLKLKLAPEGYDITSISSAQEAISLIRSQSHFDVILSDLKMPEMSGLDLIEELKREGIDTPVILMTAHGSLESAIDAMRKGAFDYVLKPLNFIELKLSIEKALKLRKLERDNIVLRRELKQAWSESNIIGKSKEIRSVFEMIRRVAPTQANVLITGESGTGKELVARALHQQSSRANGPFIAINCSAIPSELLESELFGHVKGAFTGAHQNKKGLFEEAHEGTIFLDEIGDLELALQAKLLRVLQEKKIKPVGETKTKDINVRILAATHKDLRLAIKENRFREDLFYRLCVIPIEIPPLRQRKEDIPLLAEHFLKKHAAAHGLNVFSFTPEALSKLVNHVWEGNVRELENIVERSVILTNGERVSAEDLPELQPSIDPVSLLEEKAADCLTLQEVEKYYIGMILRRHGGKKQRVAHILGIDRKTLRRKEKEYGLVSSNRDLDDSDLESQPLSDENTAHIN